MSCEAAQERLVDAWLAGEATPATDAEHASACEACGACVRELLAIAERLDSLRSPPLRAAALTRCKEESRRALRALRVAHEPAPLRGMGRDMLRAAAVALLALPVAAGHALLVGYAGSTLLGPLVPAPVLAWLGVFYFVPVVVGLGVLYGAIPIAVAVGRRRAEEEP